MDMFQAGNATTIVEGNFGSLESGLYEVMTGSKIEIPYEVQPGSVFISGLTEADSTAEPGKFVVTITSSGTVSTSIELDPGDAAIGEDVRVYYRRRINASQHLPVGTNTTAARGELWAHYPLFSSGSDCTDATRKGMLHIFIPRCRATALPGFDSSYKSAQTFGITFSAMDPKRADGKMWSLFYEPFDANGDIVTTPGSGDVDWGVSS